jgi:hypothetical protein
MEKFNDIKSALAREARVVVGIKRPYEGAADITRFEKDFGADLDYLHFSQTRIFEKNVRYVTKSRIGAN